MVFVVTLLFVFAADYGPNSNEEPAEQHEQSDGTSVGLQLAAREAEHSDQPEVQADPVRHRQGL